MQGIKFFTATIFLLVAQLLFAQQKNHFTKREMKRNPVWIEMIKDERVNYFEATKAFELYFTVHQLPVMEEEEMGKNTKLIERTEKSEEKAKRKKHKPSSKPTKKGEDEHEATKLAFEVKRFKQWEMQVKPYVKEDGSIMTADEQEKIWMQQKVK